MKSRKAFRGRLESLEERRMLTTFGSSLLMEFTEGSASTEFANFQSAGDHLYFTANEELWRTDGTQEGTERRRKFPLMKILVTYPTLASREHRPANHLLGHW